VWERARAFYFEQSEQGDVDGLGQRPELAAEDLIASAIILLAAEGEAKTEGRRL
jgi:hypothetical protein